METSNTPGEKINWRGYLTITVTCLLCWTFAYLAINKFRQYAFGLFIWLPLVLGATSTLIYGLTYTSDKQKLFNISLYSLCIFCLGLLVFAWEGMICLIMALPVGLFFTWMGHLLGYQVIKTKKANTTTVILLFVSVPSLMAFEKLRNDKDQIRSVVTSIEIKAAPQKVWKNVIAFQEIKKPSEFIFKTGIAYPINATIEGHGVGAVRHCNFSTGSFVEPITIWDEPKLLKFTVDEQPEPMKELSFFDIHPNHLHGYWISKEGQFKLTLLANGNTLLEGTTWYVNKIKPGIYWSLWSDFIVHKIHTRVLEHIKMESEK
jgi:hypothetical protein